jgi:hypothetical protein
MSKRGEGAGQREVKEGELLKRVCSGAELGQPQEAIQRPYCAARRGQLHHYYQQQQDSKVLSLLAENRGRIRGFPEQQVRAVLT